MGEANRPRALDMLKIMDDHLAKYPFVAGANFTVADITTMVSVDFMKPAKIEMPSTLVNVARWHKDVSARPSAKA
jgi:glutathione S-transferase